MSDKSMMIIFCIYLSVDSYLAISSIYSYCLNT